MYILLECDLPKVVVGILRQVYNVLMIAIPAGIVLFGTIDFLKASMAKDDKAATTNATIFIKRLVSGALALFVFALVKMVFTIIGNVNEASQAFACASDILGGKYTGNGSYNFDWIKDTLDKDSVGQKCLSDCNNYCGTKTNSYAFVQACSSYCAGYQRNFNTSDAPCN